MATEVHSPQSSLRVCLARDVVLTPVTQFQVTLFCSSNVTFHRIITHRDAPWRSNQLSHQTANSGIRTRSTVTPRLHQPWEPLLNQSAVRQLEHGVHEAIEPRHCCLSQFALEITQFNANSQIRPEFPALNRPVKTRNIRFCSGVLVMIGLELSPDGNGLFIQAESHARFRWNISPSLYFKLVLGSKDQSFYKLVNQRDRRYQSEPSLLDFPHSMGLLLHEEPNRVAVSKLN